MTPEAAMRQALACARRARGRSFPNPPVGAVVFRGDRVLGRGATRNVGGPHAEVVAIRGALRRYGASGVRGASIAVTLEPCNHHGRTAPCSELLVEAGLRAGAGRARGSRTRRSRAAASPGCAAPGSR